MSNYYITCVAILHAGTLQTTIWLFLARVKCTGLEKIRHVHANSRGDQGKLSNFAIKSTKKPMYQQILENEYCIWYKKYLHICVSNMNCTGLAIITWWAFKKSMECGSTYPSYGLSWSMPWGKLIQVAKRSFCTLKTIKFLIVYYTDIFSSYSLVFNYS